MSNWKSIDKEQLRSYMVQLAEVISLSEKMTDDWKREVLEAADEAIAKLKTKDFTWKLAHAKMLVSSATYKEES
jgi:hypothetical protein